MEMATEKFISIITRETFLIRNRGNLVSWLIYFCGLLFPSSIFSNWVFVLVMFFFSFYTFFVLILSLFRRCLLQVLSWRLWQQCLLDMNILIFMNVARETSWFVYKLIFLNNIINIKYKYKKEDLVCAKKNFRLFCFHLLETISLMERIILTQFQMLCSLIIVKSMFTSDLKTFGSLLCNEFKCKESLNIWIICVQSAMLLLYPLQVANTPGVSTDSVAELTVALLLMTARRLPEGYTLFRDIPFHWIVSIANS